MSCTVGQSYKNILRLLIYSLQQNTQLGCNLADIDISSSNISKEVASDIAAVLCHNTKLQKLYLSTDNAIP